MLVHEIAHVLRRDHLVVLLQVVAKAAFWPIMFVHLFNRHLDRAREEVCDNHVLSRRDAVSYGETLLRLAGLARDSAPIVASVGILHWRGKLEIRIAGLIHAQRNKGTGIGRFRAGAVLSLFVLATLVMCGMRLDSALAQPARPASGATAQQAGPQSVGESPPTDKTVSISQLSADLREAEAALRNLAITADVTTDDVLAAWRERRKRVRTFRFSWTEVQVYPEGSLYLPPEPQYEGVVFPKKDTSCRVKTSCSMDGMMMRFEFAGESLQLYNKGKLQHRKYLSVSDLQQSKLFWPLPNQLRSYPKGIIMDQKICEDMGQLSVRPLLSVYRPLDAHVIQRHPLRIGVRAGIVDEQVCSIVEYRQGHEVWVDPARDFVPVRFTTDVGSERGVIDVSYRHDQQHGWVPKEWKSVVPRKGQTDETIVGTVARYEINTKIPRSEFQLDFPPELS